MNLRKGTLTDEELEAIQTYRGTLKLLWKRSPISTLIVLTFWVGVFALLAYGIGSLLMKAAGR